jgi:ubiquinone/menaquinone biosynthesis C-methylase UbiE
MADKVGPRGKVVAVDIQPRMLRKAKEQHAGLSNISFHEVKVGDGKLNFGQFDRAVLVTVLGEIPDREAALKEVFSALKAGGTLSVTEVIVDPHFQGRTTVLRLATSAGFRQKKFLGIGLHFHCTCKSLTTSKSATPTDRHGVVPGFMHAEVNPQGAISSSFVLCLNQTPASGSSCIGQHFI